MWTKAAFTHWILFREEIEDSEVKIALIDYVRQAKEFASLNIENFYDQMFSELANLIDYVPGANEIEKIERVWELSQRHGEQVGHALRRMREIHDNPYDSLPENSVLQMVAEREYLMRSGTAQPDSVLNECFILIPTKMRSYENNLRNHLAILRRQGVITDWHDRKIGAGREWEGEIDEHLNTAHVILLLISSDFIASDYCYDVEVQRAMERHNAGEARVIPVILRPVDWEEGTFRSVFWHCLQMGA